LSPELTAVRISTDKRIVIVAQDAATYKVMDLLDARCKDPVDGWDAGADLDLPLPAATVMDLNPTVIQLVDQLDFPVLPRNPSAGDPLSMWYIKVNSLESF
jgi:hypothetical protein